MAWAINGTPDTLVSSGDLMEITDQVATLFNVVLSFSIAVGGNMLNVTTLNGDSGSNYALRTSANGGADTTTGPTTGIPSGEVSAPETIFSVSFFMNIATEEKLIILDEVRRQTAQAPARSETVAKWVNTSVQSTQVNQTNTSSGSFNTDSNLSALGTD